MHDPDFCKMFDISLIVNIRYFDIFHRQFHGILPKLRRNRGQVASGIEFSGFVACFYKK